MSRDDSWGLFLSMKLYLSPIKTLRILTNDDK